MTQKVNPETIEAYHYAGCGNWSNPLVGSPSMSVQIWRIHDVVVGETTKSEFLNVVGTKTIPYTPAKVIDPALYDIPLPPITHEVFYAYMKTMMLDAMVEQPEQQAIEAPPAQPAIEAPLGN